MLFLGWGDVSGAGRAKNEAFLAMWEVGGARLKVVRVCGCAGVFVVCGVGCVEGGGVP